MTATECRSLDPASGLDYMCIHTAKMMLYTVRTDGSV